MALPTTRPRSSTFRVAWVHCGVFVFACIAHMAMASSDEPFKAVADYPKGCYEGPGPAEGDNIELLPPSCIFSLRGVKSDGVYQETGGIVIRTNMDGKWGEMRIQVDLKKGSTNEETEVDVETSGWAHLWFEHGDISFHLNPASGAEGFFNETFEGEIPVYVVSTIHASFPDNKQAWSPWYRTNGNADSERLELVSFNMANSDEGVRLTSWLTLVIGKVEGGWNFVAAYPTYGEVGGKGFEFRHTIAKGVLHDRL
ncbi:hypothetical protein FOZ60_015873 [Perkinsus olseni]|uniref:Uncharacterized protein n=1 Tax=Perkinsus olseni TaxID=32597 RepID=A0A7J6N4S4_PEROL|nr:hypothetical protein FOZ60_015873 [Perkinsus olseni]